MELGMQHGHRHGLEAGTWTCTMDMDMHHEHGMHHGMGMDIDYFWTNTLGIQ